MREDVPDRWDLIVSAPWVGEDKRGAVDYLVDQIKSRLGKEHLTCLSRIVPVESNNRLEPTREISEAQAERLGRSPVLGYTSNGRLQ